MAKGIDCYLHVGTGKTGSTAQQFFFARNYDAWLKRGVLFPKSLRILDKDMLEGRLAHVMIAPDFLLNSRGDFDVVDWTERTGLKKEDGSGLEKLRSLLVSEIENTQPQKILISSENFSLEPDLVTKVCDFLKSLGLDLNLKVIVYLRRQDQFVESVTEQWIRYNGFPRKMAPIPDFYQMILNAASIVGEDNVLVRHYHTDKLKNGSSVDDLLSLLQIIPGEDFEQPEADEGNKSLNSWELIEFQRICNNHLAVDVVDLRRIFRLLGQTHFKGANRYTVFRTLEERKAYLGKFEKENEDISKRFLKSDSNVLVCEGNEPEMSTGDVLSLNALISIFGGMHLHIDKRLDGEHAHRMSTEKAMEARIATLEAKVAELEALVTKLSKV